LRRLGALAVAIDLALGLFDPRDGQLSYAGYRASLGFVV
jgi:hypothetical protein